MGAVIVAVQPDYRCSKCNPMKLRCNQNRAGISSFYQPQRGPVFQVICFAAQKMRHCRGSLSSAMHKAYNAEEVYRQSRDMGKCDRRDAPFRLKAAIAVAEAW